MNAITFEREAYNQSTSCVYTRIDHVESIPNVHRLDDQKNTRLSLYISLLTFFFSSTSFVLGPITCNSVPANVFSAPLQINLAPIAPSILCTPDADFYRDDQSRDLKSRGNSPCWKIRVWFGS